MTSVPRRSGSGAGWVVMAVAEWVGRVGGGDGCHRGRRAAVRRGPGVPSCIRRARDVRAGGRRAGRVARPRSSAVVSGRDERAERGVLQRDSGGRVNAIDVLARGRGARRSARGVCSSGVLPCERLITNQYAVQIGNICKPYESM